VVEEFDDVDDDDEDDDNDDKEWDDIAWNELACDNDEGPSSQPSALALVPSAPGPPWCKRRRICA
jgi:hypothetical protein